MAIQVTVIYGQGSEHAYETKQSEKQKAQIDISKAISDVDDIYNRLSVMSIPRYNYEEVKKLIDAYIVGLPNSTTRQLQDHFYDEFFIACDNENLELAVNLAFKYLLIGGKNDEDVFWKFLVDSYGSKSDTYNTIFLLDRFNNISVAQGNAYASTILSLRKEYDDVINPISFDNALKGYWISLKNESELKNKHEMMGPDYFLRINDLKRSNGCWMLKAPTLAWETKKENKYWYYNTETQNNNLLSSSQSLFCDVDKKFLDFVFASEEMKNGHFDLAHGLLEADRERRAIQSGINYSKDQGILDDIRDEAINSTISIIVDVLASSLANSSKVAEGYNIQFYGLSPSVMNAYVLYNKVKVMSSGSTEIIERNHNPKYTFVKWEPSDSVIFIDNRGKPMFTESLGNDSPLLKEYNDVKKRINFWKPKYCIPTFIGAGACGYGMYKGIKLMIDDAKENKQTGEIGKKGKQGFVWFFGSSTVLGCVLGIFLSKISSDRMAAYNEINKNNMRKMRQKAAELSLQPSYDPVDHAVGMNFQLSF